VIQNGFGNGLQKLAVRNLDSSAHLVGAIEMDYLIMSMHLTTPERDPLDGFADSALARRSTCSLRTCIIARRATNL
jgi:hypothetical protein